MGTRICVAGLSSVTTPQQIQKLCEPYGTVKSVSMIRNRKTGQWVGCGFVEMASPEEAMEVIFILNGTRLNGQTLEVFFAPLALSG
jgi:RNA recognition motif-containing protein